MKTLYKLCLVLSAFMLSSCIFTNMVWDEKTNIKKQQEQDNLLGFGIASADSAQLSKGQILMIGEKYWYAIDPTTDNKLRPILESPFKNSYIITPPSITITHYATEEQEEQNDKFTLAPLLLKYQEDRPPNKSEQQQHIKFMEEQGFKFDKDTGYWNYYLTGIKGTVYRIDTTQTPPLQSFTQKIPLQLNWEIITITDMPTPVKVLLTPVALAGDAISSVVLIPTGLIIGLSYHLQYTASP